MSAVDVAEKRTNLEGETEMSNGRSTEFGGWTLKDIIEGRYFRVPDYQRGYAWSSRQLDEFWEDITAVMNSGCRHYTGAITVEALPDSDEMVSRNGYEIVDGQQRLTTVAVLLSVLMAGDSPFVSESQGEVGYVFAYGKANGDRQFLCDILSGNDPGVPQNSHQRNLKAAFESFRAKVLDLDLSQKQKLVDVLMSRLTFDFRILDSDYNAGIVFETMNNRGRPLTLLEKLKNRLMYLLSTLTTEGDEEDKALFEDDKASLRQEINEAWGEIYRDLASDPRREPLDEDEFIAAHLSIYRAPKESVYSRSVAEARLFKMFCADAERHPKSERIDEDNLAIVKKSVREENVSIAKIQDYVEDLVAFAGPWAKIHSDFNSAIGRCRLLSGTQEVKIFLATVLLHAGDIGVGNSIVELAEMILFRNTVGNIMDEATFASLARRLHGKCLDMLRKGDNEQLDAQGVEDSLRVLVDDEWRQPTVGRLVEYFAGLMERQQSPYGFYGWRGLKYFLFKQEGCDGLDWSAYDQTSLEHVMPQSSVADNDTGWWVRQVREFTSALGYGDWDGLSDREKKDCRQCKRNLVNSLGNFVLLMQSENASVSDDPWEGYPAVNGGHKAVIGKKAFYSDLSRTSSAGARNVAEIEGAWNAFRIRERGRVLFRKLVHELSAAEDLTDESIDLALGFEPGKSLEDSSFDGLPEEDVNRLAPKLGTAAVACQEPRRETKRNEANVTFWESFSKWCHDNGKKWCTSAVASRGNPYYDPQGGGECHIFFAIGNSSGRVHGHGRLLTIGIYCASGEALRNSLKQFQSEFDAEFVDAPFDFQDWESGRPNCIAKSIRFVRCADYLNATPKLFERMALDYEGILAVLKRHK